MTSIRTSEVCKVRSAAVGLEGKGYSLAVFKRANKCSARIIVLDTDYALATEHTVNLQTLWKIKASQRKVLQRKVRLPSTRHEETEAPPGTGPVVDTELFFDAPRELHGLRVVASRTLPTNTKLYIANDSVVKFTGDAIVNAANELGLGGGGIDGVVNDLGGAQLYEARRALPLINPYVRIPTGDAKMTFAGNLPCDKVIHAVGPRFSHLQSSHPEDLATLGSAYENALTRAQEQGLKSVAFCLLSSGIFRGNCPLRDVVECALDSIARHAYSGLETVILCAFTQEEQFTIAQILSSHHHATADVGQAVHDFF